MKVLLIDQILMYIREIAVLELSLLLILYTVQPSFFSVERVLGCWRIRMIRYRFTSTLV